MTSRSVPRINKVPFFVADFALLALAGWLVLKSAGPLAGTPLALMVGCVVAAFVFAVAPYVLEYQAVVKFAEADQLTDTVEQVGKVEAAAEQIRLATSLWQGVQDQSARTAAAAQEIAGRMTEEAKAFAEFMQKANDTERATLRLEVDKFRRAERDWLQVLVRLMDHTFALHQAALRSGQRNLIDQLGQFQNACRDATRRVGFVAIDAAPGEPFDAAKHQTVEPAAEVPAAAIVAETVATGFTYQGQLLRLPLVRLQSGEPAVPAESAAPAEPRDEPVAGQDGQDELGLEVEAGGDSPPAHS